MPHNHRVASEWRCI